MGKGAKGALLSNSGNAQQRSATTYGDSQGDYNFLDPTLQKEATNPQGYTPQQLAYMNTASQQSLGGGTAATTGTANLEAARSKNVGGFQGAVGSANRGTQRQASQNALGIQEQQANLQQAQKQQALSSLQSLYGTNLTGSEGYLNSSNTALNAENQAPDFWQQYILTAESAAAKAAAGGGGGGG
jgi:hypothetical protein